MAAQQVKVCFSAELINWYGNFNTNAVKKFEKDVELAKRGRSYAIVSIIGPQGGGKSTLLNDLFDTDFKMRDPREERLPCTKGIWLAQNPSVQSCILVLDAEGSDGKERTVDPTIERKIALFVIAMSDIVMINIWYHDIGRRDATCYPLLSIVFEVMLRIITSRKIHLVFVVRDTDPETPSETVEGQMKREIDEMWNEIPKPPSQVNTSLYDRFEITVKALPTNKYQKDRFKEKVGDLRDWIISNSTSGEGASERIPASGFVEYAKKIWDEIKENKDLDLPSCTITVSEVRCNRIAQEQYQSFCENESWLQIENEVTSSAVVQDFGSKVSSLIDEYQSRYNTEALDYDETKRDEYKKQLLDNILKVVKPTHFSVVDRMRREILQSFEKEAMDELKKNGRFVTMNIHMFVNKLDDQLKDAVIRQANWNQNSEQLRQLESDMARYVEWVHRTNELLEKQERDKQQFWLKVASMGGAVLIGTAGVAASVVLPPGIGTSVTFHSMAVASAILTRALDNQ